MALIDAGAQLDLQDDMGCTALMVASRDHDEGNTEIAVALINARAQLDLQDDDGFTALMVASNECRTEIARALHVISGYAGKPVMSGKKDRHNGLYSLLVWCAS